MWRAFWPAFSRPALRSEARHDRGRHGGTGGSTGAQACLGPGGLVGDARAWPTLLGRSVARSAVPAHGGDRGPGRDAPRTGGTAPTVVDRDPARRRGGGG